LNSNTQPNTSDYTFPKRVGIIFVERRRRSVQDSNYPVSKKERNELALDFDQDACTFFVLNMNQHQNIFKFGVLNLTKIPKRDAKPNNKNTLLNWLDNFALEHSNLRINL
jgi:hypothetical protein